MGAWVREDAFGNCHAFAGEAHNFRVRMSNDSKVVYADCCEALVMLKSVRMNYHI